METIPISIENTIGNILEEAMGVDFMNGAVQIIWAHTIVLAMVLP